MMYAYVCLRDTPDATRPFLVDIAPSRVVLALFYSNSSLHVLYSSTVRSLVCSLYVRIVVSLVFEYLSM